MYYVNFNGKIHLSGEPVLLASNRGFRYGDGLFETIKVVNGRIQLEGYHFERLFSGLLLLKYEMPGLFTEEKLKDLIIQLCQKNKCINLARVRLSVFRGNGGLYDDDRSLQYMIECWPLSHSICKLNDNGLAIDIFPDARKSCDKFSNLKSANFLLYSMAALYAKEHKVNDCLVLNTLGNIADSSIANVFILKDGIVSTPALGQGCVNGVMRKYVIQKMRDVGCQVLESKILIEDVETADEIFLTNAITGIRWVKQFRDIRYLNEKINEIYGYVVKEN